MSPSFCKYHGAGNDFILFEDFKEDFLIEKIPELCHRRFGIGADGVILARHSTIADFQMVYFNADGSLASMCGNGLRCFVHFLYDKGYQKSEYLIEIAGLVLTVKVIGSKIYTYFPKVKILKWEVPLGKYTGYVVDTGVPHAVIFASEEVDVVCIGKCVREDRDLHPDGVNVNFVWPKGKDAFLVRTYERGVEGETLACGTGAAAVAFVANRLGKSAAEVDVIPKSGEKITITLGEEIKVLAPSTRVFQGEVKLNTYVCKTGHS